MKQVGQAAGSGRITTPVRCGSGGRGWLLARRLASRILGGRRRQWRPGIQLVPELGAERPVVVGHSAFEPARRRYRAWLIETPR